MTRRDTAWWSTFVPTSPRTFLQRAEGDRLLGLLADWWIAEENLLGIRSSRLNHSRRAVSRRYRRAEFYVLLADAGFPELSDRDEHAIDTVLRVFLGWASSERASELIAWIERKELARQKILARPSQSGPPLGLGHLVHERSEDEFHSLATYEVHEQVDAWARTQIHSEVRAHLRAEVWHTAALEVPVSDDQR
jgi:hypothetical protein